MSWLTETPTAGLRVWYLLFHTIVVLLGAQLLSARYSVRRFVPKTIRAEGKFFGGRKR
jgi:hypothetical protein